MADPAFAAAPPPCPNCGAPPVGNFCAVCGQPAGEPARDFASFVHELLATFFAFDGRVWRSMAPLFARPGRLTREWIDGRRMSFVPPLRLFFFFMILLFLVVQCKVDTTQLLVRDAPDGAERAAVAAGEDAPPAANADVIADAPSPVPPATRRKLKEESEFGMNFPLPDFWPFTMLSARLENQRSKLQHMAPAARDYVLSRRGLELAPIAILLLLPLMASFLQLWWARTGSYWLDHLVFLLHAYSFCCGLTVFLVLVPLPGLALGLLLGLGVPLYFLQAMRVVYRRGFWRSLFGTLIGGFLTTFAAVLVMILLVPYALLTV